MQEHREPDPQQDQLNQRTQEILQTQRPLYDEQRAKAQELEQVRRRRPIPVWQAIIVLVLAVVLVLALLALVASLH